VDLFQALGSPVYATFDGVVDKVQRNSEAGGIAGKFIWLSHKGGAVVTAYVHLDQISAHIQRGVHVRGGEMIGTLGRTGIKRSLPHLHYGLAVQEGRRRTWIDPETLLWHWRMPGKGQELNEEAVAQLPPTRTSSVLTP
jgi:murein DD-endopeptidase MepM/ murein hydrolase activator NlpD